MVSTRSLFLTVGKETILYGVAGVLTRLISLLSLPLLASHLTVAEYGLFDLIYLSSGLLITFFLFGQDSAILRYFHEQDDNHSKAELISGVILNHVGIAAVVSMIIYISVGFLDTIFRFNYLVVEILPILLMIVPFGILYSISEIVLRVSSNLKGYLLISIGLSCSILLAIIYATQILSADLVLLFKLYFSAWVVVGFLCLIAIRKWLVLPKKIKISKQMITYGIPMGMIVLIELIQPVMERIIVSSILSPDSLGLFAVAAKISLIMILPVGAFQMAFLPLVMRVHKDEGSIDLFNLILTVYATALTVFVLLMTSFAKPLVSILAGDTYLGSVDLVFPLTTAIFFNSLGVLLGIGTIISQKTYLRLFAQVISQLFCYALMVALASTYNILGIALAIMLGKALLSVLNAALGQYLIPMKWKYRIVWIMSIAVLIFGYFLVSSGNGDSPNRSLLLYILPIVLVIGWLNLSKDEKVIMKSFI